MNTEAKLSGPYQIEDSERGRIVGHLVTDAEHGPTVFSSAVNLVLLRRDIDGRLLWVPFSQVRRYPQRPIEEPEVKGGGACTT